MFDLLLGWMASHTYPNALYVGLLAVALLLLAILIAIYRRGIRRGREQFDDLIAKYHTLRDNYEYLRDGGGVLSLTDPDACDQAEALREYAEQVLSLSDGRDPFDVPHVVARGMEDLADELDPPEDEDDEADAGELEEDGVAAGLPAPARND